VLNPIIIEPIGDCLDHPFMVILRVVYSWVYHPQVSSIVSHHFMGLSPALMVISMMSDQLPSLFSPYKACRNRGGHAQKAPAQGSESCAVWGCIAGLFQWVLTLFYGFTLWQWKTPANGGWYGKFMYKLCISIATIDYRMLYLHLFFGVIRFYWVSTLSKRQFWWGSDWIQWEIMKYN
jgi:hypothetical protein